jgi:hypothetical protein
MVRPPHFSFVVGMPATVIAERIGLAVFASRNAISGFRYQLPVGCGQVRE